VSPIGLDITAFENATLVDDEHEQGEDADGNWCNEDPEYGGKGHVRAYMAAPSFSQSFRGLEEGRCYLTEGETFGFRAGSYSGHGAFRDALSEVALGVTPDIVWGDPDAYKEEPFFELINFSDCEGTIGPEACADLARDFQEGLALGVRARLESYGYDGYLAEKYDEWQKAFELAADTGLVDFH
jgi:hypothetical protein